MVEWVLKYWLEVGFGLILAMVALIWRTVRRRMKEQDSIRHGLQALLRNEIIDKYNHYMEKGYCPIYAMDNLESMYREYVALDGNGTVPHLMEELKELPTQRSEKK